MWLVTGKIPDMVMESQGYNFKDSLGTLMLPEFP